jgi:hypothetical protein
MAKPSKPDPENKLGTKVELRTLVGGGGFTRNTQAVEPTKLIKRTKPKE